MGLGKQPGYISSAMLSTVTSMLEMSGVFSVNKLIISLASENSNFMIDNGLSHKKYFVFVQKPKENPQGQLISKAANTYLAITKTPAGVMVSE